MRAGYGSSGSRSMRKAGTAIVTSARQVIEKGKALAADLLEAAAADIEYGEGRFRVAGTDHAVTLFQVAAESEKRGQPLAAHNDVNAPEETFPNGCHVAEVEVDPETGHGRDRPLHAAEDLGTLVNPMLVEGRGGRVASRWVSASPCRKKCCSTKRGLQVNPNLTNYIMPTSLDMPEIEVDIVENFDPTGPFGAKGVGEPTSVPTAAAILNAIHDAVGVRIYSLPATAEKILAAIKEKREGAAQALPGGGIIAQAFFTARA